MSLRRHLLIGLLALLVIPLIAAGCGSGGQDEDGRPRALTTFTVVADMVREVAGDRVEVVSITKPGSEIHGYEPTPSDLRNASGADMVLWNGLELERWFEQFIDQTGLPSAVLTDGIETIPITGETEYAGMPNPHAWMSVSNAPVYVENIVDALTEIDPGGEAVFRRNAERYIGEIESLRQEIADELDQLPEGRRLLVTCEGAFSYLARDFGLREAYIWPVNAEREGTPQQVGEVVDAVRESEVPAVFCESTVSHESMEQVAEESGSRLAGTLYVDSLSREGGPVPTYLELLRHDIETIAAGLTGGPQSPEAPRTAAEEPGAAEDPEG